MAKMRLEDQATEVPLANSVDAVADIRRHYTYLVNPLTRPTDSSVTGFHSIYMHHTSDRKLGILCHSATLSYIQSFLFSSLF